MDRGYSPLRQALAPLSLLCDRLGSSPGVRRSVVSRALSDCPFGVKAASLCIQIILQCIVVCIVLTTVSVTRNFFAI